MAFSEYIFGSVTNNSLLKITDLNGIEKLSFYTFNSSYIISWNFTQSSFRNFF